MHSPPATSANRLRNATPNCCLCFFFFFNDTATTEIYTLSLHDALPISRRRASCAPSTAKAWRSARLPSISPRSEEHTSELQSRRHLVCRLLLEKEERRSEEHTSELQSRRHLVCRLLLGKSHIPTHFSFLPPTALEFQETIPPVKREGPNQALKRIPRKALSRTLGKASVAFFLKTRRPRKRHAFPIADLMRS